MAQFLSDYFDLKRRYLRSINIERDLDQVETLNGYILTDKAVEALKRILPAFTNKNTSSAWTLTGVYGTGKSAFAHFLISLCAPYNSKVHEKARSIACKALSEDNPILNTFMQYLSTKQSLFRAVVTSQKEHLSHSVIRALMNGLRVSEIGSIETKEKITRQLNEYQSKINSGTEIDSSEILNLIESILKDTGTDLLLVFDELGKNLEFAAHRRSDSDLYLLQQLAEFPRNSGNSVHVIGLLHQAFSEYASEIGLAQCNEWTKIQGRFEDIAFTDSSREMLRLIGQVIEQKENAPFLVKAKEQAPDWIKQLRKLLSIDDISADIISSIYPLHPVSALVLPKLCVKYAQNNRSLFTFLTSPEPASLKNYLALTEVDTERLPLFKLDKLYDYFIESIGVGFAAKQNLQRYLEIQSLLKDTNLDPDSLQALKAIGVLNLVTSAGFLKATRELVSLALCDEPDNSNERAHWESIIDSLLDRGLITHRKRVDELRMWKGSDFDVEAEIAIRIEKERTPLATLLNKFRPLKPIIAQRHSFRTGTLRLFERVYLDSSSELEKLECTNTSFDGLIGYWLDKNIPVNLPERTVGGKPLIIYIVDNLEELNAAALELAALCDIERESRHLETDGVARKEVKHRLFIARTHVDKIVNELFENFSTPKKYWVEGTFELFTSTASFNARLSEVCDRAYGEDFVLWNELINRRELTSQGSKARRLLIEAMLEHQDKDRLGFKGNGPEVSMYISVLQRTGIHRKEGDHYGFYPPLQSEVASLWNAIENFCLEANNKPRSLEDLYKRVTNPPYGIKLGVIPIFVAAVLLHHVEDVILYKDGSFIPVIGAEHFELLVKHPSRFSVKYVGVAGLKAHIFRDFETILCRPGKAISSQAGARNTTLLSVIKPLYRFTKRLPQYTLKTKSLSLEAQAVLKVLLQAYEPDELLFTALPKACGFDPIPNGEADNDEKAEEFRIRFVQILQEIQTAYEGLLGRCHDLLHNAFKIHTAKNRLREDLQIRASHLKDICAEPLLKRFIYAATDDSSSDKEWLEALVMVVADKPAEVWSDEDAGLFEIKLSELARKFNNLEALGAKNRALANRGVEASQITITKPNGIEIHEVAWLDSESSREIDELIEGFISLNNLRNDRKKQLAIIAKLTERLFDAKAHDAAAQISK